MRRVRTLWASLAALIAPLIAMSAHASTPPPADQASDNSAAENAAFRQALGETSDAAPRVQLAMDSTLRRSVQKADTPKRTLAVTRNHQPSHYSSRHHHHRPHHKP